MPSSKIKVLHVIPAFATGGAEVYLYHLCKLINRDVFEIYIISFLKGDLLADKFNQLNDVHIISFDYSSRYDCRLLPSLVKAIHFIKPDIIHTHLPVANIYTRLACMFSKYIIISTQHSTEYISNFFHTIDRITARRNALYIANSDYTAKFLIHYHYSKIGTTTTIPLSVQAPESISPLSVDVLAQLQLPSSARIIGMIGSFKAQKGHIYLIHALSEVVKVYPNCILLLLGEGTLIQTIQKQVRELGLEKNVRFLGLQPDIYPYLQFMEICVFPSLTESFGLAILDAMSQKVPVIAFAVDAIPELVEHEQTGILVPSVDSKKLAIAIINLLKNEDKRHFLAENAYQKHKQSFSYSSMIQDTEQVYLQLIK
jgi:glycosyltransferase involved in cell wall biosynthesis